MEVEDFAYLLFLKIQNLDEERKKKKDRIENLGSKILPRFYKQMYLWAVFLEVVVTEK